ncbi:MAG: hypothetical protein AAB443_04000 [Patescibacteria group bacterium]
MLKKTVRLLFELVVCVSLLMGALGTIGLVGVLTREFHETYGYKLVVVGVGEAIPGTNFFNKGCGDFAGECHTIIDDPKGQIFWPAYDVQAQWEIGDMLKMVPLSCESLEAFRDSVKGKEGGCTLEVILISVKPSGVLIIGVNEDAPKTIQELASPEFALKYWQKRILLGGMALLKEVEYWAWAFQSN